MVSVKHTQGKLARNILAAAAVTVLGLQVVRNVRRGERTEERSEKPPRLSYTES